MYENLHTGTDAIFDGLPYGPEMKAIYEGRMKLAEKLVARLRENVSKAESNPAVIEKAVQIFMAEYIFPFDGMVMELAEKLRALQAKRVLAGLPGAEQYDHAVEALLKVTETKMDAHWLKCAPTFSSLEGQTKAVQWCLDRARAGEIVGN